MKNFLILSVITSGLLADTFINPFTFRLSDSTLAASTFSPSGVLPISSRAIDNNP